MKPERSIRRRLIIGTIMWTLGVLLAGLLAALFALHLHAGSVRFLHDSMLAFAGGVLVVAGASAIRGALLAERDQRVTRALERAADLAHGLKTPLAILAQDVTRADAAGQHELAASIRQQVDRMQRQIASHLAQTRIVASGELPPGESDLGEVTASLVRTMQRLHAERGLNFDVRVPDGLCVRVPVEDAEELLGNLIDNACKWTRTRVVVSAHDEGAFGIVVDVDDDGPGLPAEQRARVLRRGVRADETAPGSGLGLGIVRDLADAYGGAIVLEESPLGGIRARLTLPRVQ